MPVRALTGLSRWRGGRVLAGALFLLLAAAAAAVSLPTHAAGAFRRGVNLSEWLDANQGPPVSPHELQALHSAGFDYVRIPVDPVALGWVPANGPALAQVARLHAAVETALAAGLDVIIDMHPAEQTRRAIENDSRWADAYVAMWQRVASGFQATPTDRVAFELLNEPQYYGWFGASVWARYQQRLVQAVRAVLPHHTLVVSGRKGGSLEGLLELQPLDDAHLIYSFHYYLPYLMSHQGASWMRGDTATTAAYWHDVRYPAAQSREHPPHLDGGVDVARAEQELNAYRDDGWDRQRIAAQWQPVLDWSRQHPGLRIVCGEFGVIRQGVDPASRYGWIADVRSLAEAQGWGWGLWDYSGDFGITTHSKASGDRGSLEPAALHALGLGAYQR